MMAASSKTSAKVSKKEDIKSEGDSKEETLLLWKAPARPFKKRSKEFFSTVAAIAFLVMVILVFLKEWFLIIAIIAFAFVTYVFATVPPQKIEHKITNQGIVTAGKEYLWRDLGSFWFSEQQGTRVLNIQTPFQFPGRLVLLLGDQKEVKVKELLSRFATFEKVSPTWMDKAGKWLGEKIPLEESS